MSSSATGPTGPPNPPMIGTSQALSNLYPSGGLPNCTPSPPDQKIKDQTATLGDMGMRLRCNYCNIDTSNTQLAMGIQVGNGILGAITAELNVNKSSPFGCENIALINQFIQDVTSNISCILQNSVAESDVEIRSNMRLSRSNTALFPNQNFDMTQSTTMKVVSSVTLNSVQTEEVVKQLASAASLINTVVQSATNQNSSINISPDIIVNNNQECSDINNFTQKLNNTLANLKITANSDDTISFLGGVIFMGVNFKMSQNSIFDITATAIVTEAMSEVINTSASIIFYLSITCLGEWKDFPVCDSSGFGLQIYKNENNNNSVFGKTPCPNKEGDIQLGNSVCEPGYKILPNFMNGTKDPLLTLYPVGGFPNCVQPTQLIENIFTSNTYSCNTESKKTQTALGIFLPGIISEKSKELTVNQASSFGCENIVLINKFIQDATSNISCIIKNSIPVDKLGQKKLSNAKLALSNTSLRFSYNFDNIQSSDVYFIDKLNQDVNTEEIFNQLAAAAAMINKVINQAIKSEDIQPLKITNNNKACSDTVNFLQSLIKVIPFFKCETNTSNTISFSGVNITLSGNFKLSLNSIFDIAATAIVSEAMSAVINTSASIISDLSSKLNCVGKWVDTSTCDNSGFLKQSYQIITQSVSGGSACSHATGDTQLGSTVCKPPASTSSTSIFSGPVIIFIIVLILIIALVAVKIFYSRKVSELKNKI
jgi:hypothetical protein